jgi:hypothetical protein
MFTYTTIDKNTTRGMHEETVVSLYFVLSLEQDRENVGTYYSERRKNEVENREVVF